MMTALSFWVNFALIMDSRNEGIFGLAYAHIYQNVEEFCTHIKMMNYLFKLTDMTSYFLLHIYFYFYYVMIAHFISYIIPSLLLSFLAKHILSEKIDGPVDV